MRKRLIKKNLDKKNDKRIMRICIYVYSDLYEFSDSTDIKTKNQKKNIK